VTADSHIQQNLIYLYLLAELNCNMLNYSSTPLTVTVRLSVVEV